jgi:dienelactone hydrolase
MSRLAAVLAVASGILLSSPARAQIPAGARTIHYNYDESSDGTIESVGSLLLPKGYDPARSTTYPLVVVYHGFGEAGADYSHMNKNIGNLLRRGYDTGLPDGGFFVYAPQAVVNPVNVVWNWAKAEVTMRILARILQEHRVDKTRLYVTGLSNGGGATWIIASRYSDIFSAAVPICGANLSGDESPDLKDEYIWAFHARNDTQDGARVSNTRSKVNDIREYLGYPRFTGWPVGTADWDYESHANHAIETPRLKYKEYGTGGHNIWGKVYAYDAMYSWMRSLHTPVTTLEVGETMLFDFGSRAVPTDSRGRVWNSTSGGTVQKTLLPFLPFARISTGQRKFVVAEVTSKFTGGTTTGGVSTGTMRYDADINRDSWVTGTASEVGTITIRGLVPGARYDLTCFASAGTTNNGWITTYRAEGKTADLVVGNNATHSAVLSDVIAKADGSIVLQVQAKAPALRGYIGALELKRNGVSVQPLYAQAFQAGNTLSTYYSSTPSVGQLNDLTSDWSIVGGRLQQTRSSTSAHTGFTRLQQAGMMPNVLRVEFDIHVTGATNSSDMGFFDLGPLTSLHAYTGSIPNVSVASRLLIRGAGSAGIRFQINGAYSSDGTTPTFAKGTTWRVVWLTNLSGTTVSYVGPDGSAQSLPSGTNELWVGNAATGVYGLVFWDMPRNSVHTASTMGGFRFRSVSTADITMALDNIHIHPPQ